MLDMIPRTAITWHTEARSKAPWQKALAEAIRDPRELLAALDLPQTLLPEALAATDQFALRVPRGYVARMERANPQDPLLLQVLPLGAELHGRDGFATDPVGDLGAMPVPGVLQKYRGRVLLVTTGACAIHCRYCFRRHFPYGEANPAADAWQDALSYIRSDPGIEEVILSGGDPLSLTDQRLSALAMALTEIPHLRRLRLHTRQPIVLPERVDTDLADWLHDVPLQTVIVIHANHPNELDATVDAALSRLRGAGVTLLNQTVLLRGINDSVDTLAALSERLFASGVLPYYLHQLDRVQGSAHFEVDERKACRLVSELRACLPGYLVPRFVREIAGQPSKTPVVDESAKDG